MEVTNDWLGMKASFHFNFPYLGIVALSVHENCVGYWRCVYSKHDNNVNNNKIKPSRTTEKYREEQNC